MHLLRASGELEPAAAATSSGAAAFDAVVAIMHGSLLELTGLQSRFGDKPLGSGVGGVSHSVGLAPPFDEPPLIAVQRRRTAGMLGSIG